MINLKKILFPTDFSSCSDQAFSHAIDLARKHKAELHLLHAIVESGPGGYYSPNPEEKFEQIKRATETLMKAQIEKFKATDLKIVESQLPAVSAGTMIPSYVTEFDIDLVVMGTHGRRGLGHLFLGSIAEEVIRTANSPVFTVRELKEPKLVGDIKNILVPVDFSEHSRKAFLYAKELASLYGAKLQLLHVIDEPVYPAFYVLENIFLPNSITDLAEKAKLEMERLARENGPEILFEVHVINGKAPRDIPKYAEKHDSDLIVIATHGLTGIEHLLIGSVTEKVVRFAACPVFTVKAFGKSLI